nr:MAG TPA: protein of unknown function (DUF4376) [Caudoviricetes sp.]
MGENMKAYLFNPENKEFEAEIEAQIDPLESVKQKKEIYLLPANSTYEKPLDEKDGFKVKWQGSSWIYEKIPEPKPEQEPTIEELKLIKRSEINAARDAAEQGGFEYMGKTFDSDPISCQRISTAAQAMAFAPEETAIVWTCQDNTTISLNKTQLSGLVAALAQWSNTCHQKATALKAEVEKAQTKEELDKITW